jgi:hypothetical protein
MSKTPFKRSLLFSVAEQRQRRASVCKKRHRSRHSVSRTDPCAERSLVQILVAVASTPSVEVQHRPIRNPVNRVDDPCLVRLRTGRE